MTLIEIVEGARISYVDVHIAVGFLISPKQNFIPARKKFDAEVFHSELFKRGCIIKSFSVILYLFYLFCIIFES